MKVYLVWSLYHNFCDEWKTLVCVCADELTAMFKVEELTASVPKGDEQQSYIYSEEDVLPAE